MIKILFFLVLFALCACVSTGDGSATATRKAAGYNAQLGIEYLRRGDLPSAHDRIERALKQDAHNCDVRTAAALLSQKLNRNDEAEGHWKAALRLKPNDPEVLNMYGVFLCNQKRAEEGEKLFLKAATNPLYRTPEMAYRNAAVCLQDAGRVAAAQDYFEKAGVQR